MPMLLITCPKTGKPVPTGVGMDAGSFADPSNRLSNNSVGCPHCDQSHVWDKQDAYLEGQEPKAQAGPR